MKMDTEKIMNFFKNWMLLINFLKMLKRLKFSFAMAILKKVEISIPFNHITDKAQF